MPIIIDGYNLLRSIQKTSEYFEQLSNTQLCLILSAYLGRIRDHAQIIFDGTGPVDKISFEHITGLDVVFSGADCDADTIIEQKISVNSAPKRLKVVSTDRRIRSAARKRKAVSVRSDVFWENVLKQLARDEKVSPEPKEKRHGLTKAETKHWLKYFGFEK